jgi:hypothetical protein
MEGMSERDIKVILRVDRQEALHRFFGDYFIPYLADRGYSLQDLFQSLGSWCYRNDHKKAANHVWDAATEFYKETHNV